MQLEHRVGQLLIIGLPGTVLDSQSRELLDVMQPGGVLLSASNIESAQQTYELTSAIRRVLKVPPIIAVDQEGGRVDRLSSIYSPMPSADLLRASGDVSIAARLGEITAEALRLLGVNVNFAPVLDVAVDDNGDNGLKGRYLGSSVAQVIRLAGGYLEGLQRGGVIGVGKHFPGLGAAFVDAHSQLPVVDCAKDEIVSKHVAPYAELFSKINARLNAVMVAHAHYPAIDGPAELPASLSKKVAGNLLREELGFRGMCISDDLEMGAITSTRSVPDAAVAAIEAGIDAVLIQGIENAHSAWQAMVEASHGGRIARNQIGRAFDHIAGVKSMVSPPHQFSDLAVLRIRDRVAELNLLLQHSR